MKFMQLALLTSGAPVYLSFPHFYKADPKLLDAVDGLKPVGKLHETYFKIQPVSKTRKKYFKIFSYQQQIRVNLLIKLRLIVRNK